MRKLLSDLTDLPSVLVWAEWPEEAGIKPVLIYAGEDLDLAFAEPQTARSE